MSAYMYTITAVRKDMLKTGLNEQERLAFQAHTLYLEDLAKKGVLIVADDPFVSRGVVKPTLMPFGLAAGTALERKKGAI